MGYHQLDELDEKILKLIVGNARIPFLEVARECNVSGAAIHQRIQKLTNLGVSRALRALNLFIDNTKVGYETCAYMGLFFEIPGAISGCDRGAKSDTGSGRMSLHNRGNMTFLSRFMPKTISIC